ncbi:glycine-rich domain-containing protein [Streptomyces sp. BH034]|uniref:glycine-rich domain-containing protein n=1 Tax=Streptomyces sp. BH034 TaxID=3402626 RepID=UPI003BB720E5
MDTTKLLTNDQMSRVLVTVRDNNPTMSDSLACRIVGEAAKFVAAGAQYDVPMAPSRVVDEGWHALILHTSLYADLCARFGRFVHHHPGYDPTNYDPQILERTRAMIERAGYSVDPDLWTAPTDDGIAVAAKCQHAPECAIRPMPTPQPPVAVAAGA